MKRMLTLTMVLMAISLVAFAQRDEIATLQLRLSDGGYIAVKLDGRYIARNTTRLTLDGIQPGLHRVSVYRDFGRATRPRRLFTATLRLRPNTFNDGVVQVRRRSLQLRTVSTNDEVFRGNFQDGFRDQMRAPDERYQGPGDDRYDRRPSENPDYNPDGDRQGYGSYPHGRRDRDNPYTTRIFNDRDMDDLRKRVADRMMDDDKEKLMENVVRDRGVSTAQVRQMLGWLTFESTKLTFAKWAYPFVTDRRNYWKLEDAFTFESSKTEFSNAISGN